MNCKVGSFSFLYLGFFIGENSRSEATWEPVVDKVKKRLYKWRSRKLSMGGFWSCCALSYSQFHCPISCSSKPRHVLFINSSRSLNNFFRVGVRIVKVRKIHKKGGEIELCIIILLALLKSTSEFEQVQSLKTELGYSRKINSQK